MDRQSSFRTIFSSDFRVPLLIALAQLVIQVIFHGNYGYFRDELYYIACSKHLALGYVDQPPLSIFILAVTRWIAGDSLQALRFLPSVAGAGVVIIAALMTKQLGGGWFAQGLAAFSVVAAHVLLGAGRYFSMNAFDVFFWTLALYVVVKIVVEDRPRLWLWFGLVGGLGLLNKYSVGFLWIGLFAALLFTPSRKHLVTRWFWLGALIAFVLFLPHLIWEIKNGLPSLEFMRNASQQKNVPTTFSEFLSGQFRDVNYINAPIWLLGLYYFFFHPDGKRVRLFGWLYIVLFAVFVIGNGKAYYLSPVYPVLFAGGAVFIEEFLRQHSWNWIKPVYVGMMLVWTIIVAPFALPILPVEQFIAYEKMLGASPKAEERSSLGPLPQGYADEFGWEEMVAGVAKVYQTLTPEEQAKCVIYVRNYGEAGAIDFFGKKYGLPNALCAHNNYWLWGPGERTGDIAIILGTSRELQHNLDDLQRAYKSVEPTFKTDCSLCMPFENGRQFFICRGMKTTFQKIWAQERFYI
jgi:hypothetical protein